MVPITKKSLNNYKLGVDIIIIDDCNSGIVM